MQAKMGGWTKAFVVFAVLELISVFADVDNMKSLLIPPKNAIAWTSWIFIVLIAVLIIASLALLFRRNYSFRYVYAAAVAAYLVFFLICGVGVLSALASCAVSIAFAIYLFLSEKVKLYCGQHEETVTRVSGHSEDFMS